MKVRALDENHDWTLGYKTESKAIAQNVKTEILSLYNDWFLDFENGIRWFNYLKKNPNILSLKRELKRQVLEVDGVKSLEKLDLVMDERKAIVSIEYIDIYDERQRVSANASN